MTLIAQSCSKSTAQIYKSASTWYHFAATHSRLRPRPNFPHSRQCFSGSSSSSSSPINLRAHSTAETEPCSAVESYVDGQDDWLQRSRLLVGQAGLDKLAAVNVLLVGLGGVGSFAAECLCRAGIGSMTIVDGDTVDSTNRNRQLPALKSTVGQLKAEVVAARLRDINPQLRLTVLQEFLDPLRAAALVQAQQYHYVIDCIDSVAPKRALLLAGHAAGAHVVSSMGAGGRLDPSRVRLADISATYNDAFAAVVRRGLRKAGVASGITVVFSDELARPASLALTDQQYKKSYFGTCSYIPALFGLYIASYVIRHVVDQDYKLPPAAAVVGSSSSKASSRKKRRGSGSSRSSDRIRDPGSSTNKQLADSGVAEAVRESSSNSSSADSSSQASRQQQLPIPEEPPSARQLGSPQACGFTSSSGGGVLISFDAAQGVGMGYDGEGL